MWVWTRRATVSVALWLGLSGGWAGGALAAADICPEPNDARESACPVGATTSAAGYLAGGDDVDRYRLEIGEGQSILASLRTLPHNYTLRLESEDGSVIAESTGGGTEDRALGAHGLPGGTYYLVVLSADGDADTDLAYTLGVSVQGTVSRSSPTIDQSAPPPPPSTDRPLDQLVLVGIEAGDKTKQSGKEQGSDDRASWYQVTFKRDVKDDKFGPLTTINRVYRARDVATAQAIFREQAAAGVPEAKQTNPIVRSLGPVAMGPLGEEASAVGAGVDFNKDEVTRHFRIVFRMGTLVETLYTYGPDSGNNMNVVYDLARIIEKRINTPPAGPPPEIFSRQSPGEIGIRVGEAGPQAFTLFERNGCDERSCWYEGRFGQPKETFSQRMGPVQVYSKVFVANSNAQARELFRENAVKQLPEADEPRGAIFDEPKTKAVGNESYAIGACNDDCQGARSEALHERLVFRWGNVVAIVYIWGREDQSNPEAVVEFANRLIGRVR